MTLERLMPRHHFSPVSLWKTPEYWTAACWQSFGKSYSHMAEGGQSGINLQKKMRQNLPILRMHICFALIIPLSGIHLKLILYTYERVVIKEAHCSLVGESKSWKTTQVHSKSSINKLGYMDPREKHVTLQKGMKGSYIY